MAFHFIENSVSTSFSPGTSPQLRSVFETGEEPLTLPRVLHRHEDCLELVLIRDGSGDYVIDGRPYQTTRGDVLIFNAGVIHDECASINESMRVYYCAAEQLLIPGLMPNQLLGRDQPAVIPIGDSTPDLENLFGLMVAQVKQGTPQSREIAQQLLVALLLLVRELASHQKLPIHKSESELGQRIQSYLDLHYQSDLTLSAIAEVFHINPYYLSHLFKEQTGFSPLQYLIRRRVGEAQSLLINTNQTVTRIATEVGFGHPNQFHQAFVKIVGLSPGRYRKSWQEV